MLSYHTKVIKKQSDSPYTMNRQSCFLLSQIIAPTRSVQSKLFYSSSPVYKVILHLLPPTAKNISDWTSRMQSICCITKLLPFDTGETHLFILFIYILPFCPLRGPQYKVHHTNQCISNIKNNNDTFNNKLIKIQIHHIAKTRELKALTIKH